MKIIKINMDYIFKLIIKTLYAAIAGFTVGILLYS